MSTSYVIASVAGQRVALDALAIEGIIRLGGVTPVPRVPDHVLGLCAVRSTVMTVIDVARAVGRAENNDADHAAVVMHEGHRYALRLDRIADVEQIDAPPCANDASIGAAWLAIAPARIESSAGAALLLDVGGVVTGAQVSDRD